MSGADPRPAATVRRHLKACEQALRGILVCVDSAGDTLTDREAISLIRRLLVEASNEVSTLELPIGGAS